MFMKEILKVKSLLQHEQQNILHIPDKKRISTQKGFTLIEVVATLVIVGLMAVLGGMAIVQTVKGYVTVRQNSAMTQKAQMAMSRITREIVEMVNVPSAATNTVLPITSATNCSVNCVRTIGLDNGAIKIAFGSSTLANGDLLMDNVTSLTFKYYQDNAVHTSWPTGQDNLLSAVDVEMKIASPNGGELTFTTRVAPRNNGNLGGAVPPSSATSAPPVGWGCFVATAAYGDPGHPMVQILRDFRDRYLISSRTGQWLVKQYYEHGPALADMIRNKPPAMLAVRCLLAPFVAFVFCLMYAPLAIPFVFFVSLMITAALFSVLRRGFPNRLGVYRSRGGILIGLIITMVIMAVLAAAMLPLFSSSYMNQVYADQGRKAYFLAESGLRYAAYKYIDATTDTTKDQALTDMNNQTYNLLDNAGSFKIIVYPLWFNTSASTSSGATTFVTQVPGTIPPEFSGTTFGGYVKVRNYNSSSQTVIGYYSYSSFNVSGTTVTFSGLSASAPTTASLPATTYPVVVLPMAKTNQTALSKGGNLLLSSTGVNALPLLNGSFTLVNPSTGAQINVNSVPTVFSYASRTGNTLYNVTISDSDQNTNWTGSLTFPSASNVVLEKFLHLSSTGSVGNISRTVTYNVPIGWLGGGSTFQKQQYLDTMTSDANWYTESGQTMGTQTFNSDGAMKVAGMVNPSRGGFLGWLAGLLGWSCGDAWNLVEWNWSNTNTNLAQAWMDAEGFLNYDLQVKVKNPEKYFFAGMNFRGRANSNDTDFYTYGVSFIRPRQSCRYVAWRCPGTFGEWEWDTTTDECGSLIPSNLFTGMEYDYSSYRSFWGRGTVYRYGLPAIVLWERTPSGSFTWLAYRVLNEADGIVTYDSSSKAYRLVDWSTLMVRISEGYSLTFSNGTTSTPIKEGDTICNSADCSGASARVVMTPILINNSTWGAGRPAQGTLVLTNVSGTFANNNPLYVNGTQLAKASAAINTTKRNYIRVYFTGTAAQGTANAVETDNNRLANPRDRANWPPDPLTDLTASTDYVTLVQWTGYNGVSAMASTSEPNAIIVTTDLLSPTWTTSSTTASFVGPDGTSAGDNIGLVTGYDSGTSTYYDDFAAQLDLKSGTGFLTPIQQ